MEGGLIFRRIRAIRSPGIIAVAALVGFALGGGGVFTVSGASSGGVPSGGVLSAPPPPGQPTLQPQITTKTTTRLFGENPFEVAVAVTQHLWPAVLPPKTQSVPDRPRGVTLLVPDDPLTAITATPLVHFPDDVPILWVTTSGIPEVTRNEIRSEEHTSVLQ